MLASYVIWDPYLQKDVDSLERVQRKATWVTSTYDRKSIVSRLMSELQLKTLQERLRIQRLTFMYKILNDQVAVPAELIDLELSVRTTVQAEETITNRSCINLEHTLLNTRNPLYTCQSQSGILFLHQLLSLTQYLPPSSVGSPLFHRVQPLVTVIASGSWQLLSRSRSRV